MKKLRAGMLLLMQLRLMAPAWGEKSRTHKRECANCLRTLVRFGGPEGIRTHDLPDANRALSQLSYRPTTYVLY